MKDMEWLIFAILAIVGFGLFNFFVKLSSGKINIFLAVALIAGIASIVGFIVFGYFKFTGQEILITNAGLRFVILAGLFTALAEFFYFLMFSKGISLSIGLPLVVGGTVLVGAVLGLIFLNEKLTPIKIIGVLVTLAGLVILSTK